MSTAVGPPVAELIWSSKFLVGKLTGTSLLKLRLDWKDYTITPAPVGESALCRRLVSLFFPLKPFLVP